MIALTLPEIDAMDDTMRCEPLRGERLTIKPQSLGELRLEHYRRSADAYQVRCTLGMGYSVDRRQVIGQNYLIGLLTQAFLAANADLTKALALLEQNARHAFVVNGAPAEQAAFEAAWAAEEPAGYREWVSLRASALRVL